MGAFATNSTTVREGITDLEVPNPSSYTFQGQYAPFKAPVFYNPKMEFSRDLAVLALKAFAPTRESPITVCDPLAGLGARGIRYAKEVPNVSRVVMGDLNCEALPVIRRNASLNGVEPLVDVFEKDANLLLTEHAEPGRRFDFIDLDPFGPPSPFIDSAVRALKNRGILAITATDTAPLCGVHAKACLRKYGATPLHADFCHEAGLRIMIATAVREALKYDLAAEALLSYSVDHYFRSYLKLTLGAKRADVSASMLGYITSCAACGWRASYSLTASIPTSCARCGGAVLRGGPMWLGPISSDQFIEQLMSQGMEHLNTAVRIMKMLATLLSENGLPPSYYVIDNICSRLKRDVPALEDVLEAVRSKGFASSQTHFHPKAIKTDAPISVIEDVVSSI